MKKNICRLIRNLILISIPLIAISLYAALFPMKYMAVEYTMWQEEKDFLKNSENKATLIIGDSRAKSGILPERVGDKVYNAAIGGSTSVEMYYAMKNYLKNHDAPEKAVIIFAPYHFCSMDNWKQTLYYNYLTVPELAEVEKEAFKYSESQVHYQDWITDLLSFKLRLPNKYLDAVYQAKFSGNYASNMEKYDSVRNEFGYTEFGTDNGNDSLNYEARHETFDYSPLVLSYYERLLTLLEENGVKVWIIQSPINQASAEKISDDFYSGYDEFMSSVEASHPDFVVEHELPAYDNIYFGDNNHLNRKGAEKFTGEVTARYDLN